MRLRRSDSNSPGITRRRRGRGFSYEWNGTAVRDPVTLDRIRSLAVPPAWEDVWISPWPHGHIQAFGTDAAGRRQYRYHEEWIAQRDRRKFVRVVDFGRALPELRAVVATDIADGAPTEAAVLASVVRLLDLGFFRIGSEQYARDHETFGIATLRKEHVTLSGDDLTFDYSAKGSVRRVVTVTDPDAARVLRTLRRRRAGSDHLFAHKSGGRWHDVRPEQVNAYIRAGAGGGYSAKDFRTWSGTVLGAVELAGSPLPTSRTARLKVERRAVEAVSEFLGNTPAVCRRSYIDPELFDRFRAGETIAATLEHLSGRDLAGPEAREAIEAAVIDLIDDGSARGARAA